MRKNNKKGFTIVELVIVIAVIAILAGVLIPTFASVVTKANESAAIQEAQSVYKELYALDLSDGKLDYKDSKDNDANIKNNVTLTSPAEITKYAENDFEYTTTKSYKVTFNGTAWTATPNA